MKAKEYLRKVKKIDKLIENKIEEKMQWSAIATSTTAVINGDRVQSSGSKQKMADAVHRIKEIEAEINSYIDTLIDTKKEVISTIEKLPEKEYDILHKVYIGKVVSRNGHYVNEYMTLEEYADAKEKSYTWATTLHGRALKNVQHILNERGSNGMSF